MMPDGCSIARCQLAALAVAAYARAHTQSLCQASAATGSAACGEDGSTAAHAAVRGGGTAPTTPPQFSSLRGLFQAARGRRSTGQAPAARLEHAGDAAEQHCDVIALLSAVHKSPRRAGEGGAHGWRAAARRGSASGWQACGVPSAASGPSAAVRNDTHRCRRDGCAQARLTAQRAGKERSSTRASACSTRRSSTRR